MSPEQGIADVLLILQEPSISVLHETIVIYTGSRDQRPHGLGDAQAETR
jgi:hypothetical protein